ncbi:glycosyltransferase family 4 protein [Holdemanella sp.]|uniref:glycosyltransferase family 4 protein n=1 Tax=Holdemanella sp. TaxID=1971762 RepID=UPI003AF15C34
MKIVFYINTLGGGGAERVVSALAKSFSAANEVIVVNSYAVDKEYELNDKVRHIYLEKNNTSRNFITRNIHRVSRLRYILKSEKPDVLISFMAEPNYRAIVASIGLKNKTIISVRNDPDKEYPGVLTGFLAKTLFRLADGIVFQTEDAKKWFPDSIQKKSTIIYNQVDDVFFNTKFHGVRHDIVSTGRLTNQKNQKMLIRAFASVADKITENLIIYGEGELRSELESLIAKLHMTNRIFLPGRIENVAETIKSAKLFVLSSDYEGMPNSLMEAMVLGIPCISTNCPCGGSRKIFEGQKNGLLVPVNDVKTLAEKIIYLLKNKPVREKISDNALKASKMFSSQVITDKWLSYINKIITMHH